MRMVDVRGTVLRVLDVGDAGDHAPIMLAAAALATHAPDRVERLTLGQLPSMREYRRWAARIDFKVAGLSLLGSPGIGQPFGTDDLPLGRGRQRPLHIRFES